MTRHFIMMSTVIRFMITIVVIILAIIGVIVLVIVPSSSKASNDSSFVEITNNSSLSTSNESLDLNITSALSPNVTERSNVTFIDPQYKIAGSLQMQLDFREKIASHALSPREAEAFVYIWGFKGTFRGM